jgi:hypothetical protein
MTKGHIHLQHKISTKAGHLSSEQTKHEYAELRKPQSQIQERMLHATAVWILSLPLDARPLALAKKYPRIVNILAKAWGAPDEFEKRLAEYMVNDRRTRQGFPLDVLMDLTNLNTHFMLIDSRVKQCAWDGVLKR